MLTSTNRPLLAMLLTAMLAGGCTNSSVQSSSPTAMAAASHPHTDSFIVDDFGQAATPWKAGTWPAFTDSSATFAALTGQHATPSRQALQLQFAALQLPKAIFYLDRDLDFSSNRALAMELYNDGGAARSVALAVRSGDLWTWQESRAHDLKPGANAVEFDLSAGDFKTGATNWQHQAHLTEPQAVHQLAIILYPSRSGSVFIDRLLTLPSALPPRRVLASTGAQSHISIRSLPSSVEQYAGVELDLSTDIRVDNPFDPDQIAIDVHFASPSGERVDVPAFYFQDFKPDLRSPVWPQSWKARFTPSIEGHWTVRAEIRSGKLHEQSAVAIFEVVPTVARGFVRASRDNPQYLAFDNGEAFFPVGLNLGWGHANPLEDYRRWLDALKQNGANVTRIWMASWAFGIEWTDSGLGHYRLDRAWLLDQVLHMAEERGIYVILVLINHGAFNTRVNPEWASNPYNAELGGPCQTPEDFMTNPQAIKLFKQRLRYIAARWSYSPNLLAWEWWNEVNLTPLSDPNLLRPWLREMTPYLHSVDPYHHLTSISYSDASDPRIVGMAELDTMQTHSYSSLDPMITMPKAYTAFSAYGTQTVTKPILYTEFGTSTAGDQPNPFDGEGIQFHNGLWASTFSGFATAAMYWWWDSYIEPNNYWYHLKGLSTFLGTENMAVLSPILTQVSTTTVQASGLGQQDHALLWLRNRQYSVDAAESDFRQSTLFGGVKGSAWRFQLQIRRQVSVTLSAMSPGTYRVAWFDTRTGDTIDESTQVSHKDKLTITAPPFDRDLAAKVTRIAS